VVARALAQHGDRLIDPAEHRLLLLKDLHQHARVVVDVFEQLLGQHEVRVGVVAVAQAIDRQPERLGWQALVRHGARMPERGRRRLARAGTNGQESDYWPGAGA